MSNLTPATPATSLDYSVGLRVLRAARGMTQANAAILAGVHESAVSRYENGARQPTGDALAGLAAAYGVTPALLTALAERPLRQDAAQELFAFFDDAFDVERAAIFDAHVAVQTAARRSAQT